MQATATTDTASTDAALVGATSEVGRYSSVRPLRAAASDDGLSSHLPARAPSHLPSNFSLYLECLPQPTLILHLLGEPRIHIEHMNAAARELLRACSCLRVRGGFVTGFAGTASETWADAVRRARRGEIARVVISRLNEEGAPQLWHVALSPLADDGERLYATRLIATVRAPARAEPGIAALKRLYGLTGAEARVLALLSSDATPSEIARVLGVAVSTVRSQLQALFQKTGARRQPELVKLALLAT